MEDIRWKQRFQNFEQSLKFLEQAIEIKNPSIVEKAGMIQFFEVLLRAFVESFEGLLQRTGICRAQLSERNYQKSI